MFEHLSDYNLILVTGPQRSGTTIVAHMIAQDTGLTYIDEQAFTASDYTTWRTTVNDAEAAVMQCPGMARFIHEVGGRDDVCVVMVHRPLDDIAASVTRINWPHDDFERRRYPSDYHGDTSAATKYRYWQEFQRQRCAHPVDVQYDELSDHPLWVDKKHRKRWAARRWQLTDGQRAKLEAS